jgi:3-deoxy-D-manno-octulosonate 8-phosphate phosphatase (KDO 8-P phosphatase)
VIEPVLAKRIRLVGFDVDGTMTDGGLYMGPVQDGATLELKRFDIQDGLGMVLLKKAGLLVAMVTGREGEAARNRAADLKVDDFVAQGAAKKLQVFEEILDRRGVRLEECAFVGDDLPDLPIMKRVALPVAVANAVEEVKAVARYTTQARGGHGAVREFIEVFLRARGTWGDVMKTYLKERGDDGS